MSELCFLTIAEASARIRARSLSPVELTQAYLDRITALDGQLNAYILVLAQQALAEARQAEAEIAAAAGRGRCTVSRSASRTSTTPPEQPRPAIRRSTATMCRPRMRPPCACCVRPAR